jgi:hypothetical protein
VRRGGRRKAASRAAEASASVPSSAWKSSALLALLHSPYRDAAV